MINYRIVSPPADKKTLLDFGSQVAARKLNIETPSWHAVIQDPNGHIGLPIHIRGTTWPDSAGFVRVLVNIDQEDAALVETIYHEVHHMAQLEKDYRRGQITDRAIGEGAANFFARTEAPTGTFNELMQQLRSDRALLALKNKASTQLTQPKRVPAPRFSLPKRAAMVPVAGANRCQKRTVQIFDVDRREWRSSQV